MGILDLPSIGVNLGPARSYINQFGLQVPVLEVKEGARKPRDFGQRWDVPPPAHCPPTKLHDAGLAPVVYIVKKETSEHLGRYFYRCPCNRTQQDCGFMVYVDVWEANNRHRFPRNLDASTYHMDDRHEQDQQQHLVSNRVVKSPFKVLSNPYVKEQTNDYYINRQGQIPERDNRAEVHDYRPQVINPNQETVKQWHGNPVYWTSTNQRSMISTRQGESYQQSPDQEKYFPMMNSVQNIQNNQQRNGTALVSPSTPQGRGVEMIQQWYQSPIGNNRYLVESQQGQFCPDSPGGSHGANFNSRSRDFTDKNWQSRY